jgi:hypothetical protein
LITPKLKIGFLEKLLSHASGHLTFEFCLESHRIPVMVKLGFSTFVVDSAEHFGAAAVKVDCGGAVC